MSFRVLVNADMLGLKCVDLIYKMYCDQDKTYYIYSEDCNVH